MTRFIRWLQYVQFLCFLLCIDRAGFALNTGKHRKADINDVEKSSHQGEDAEDDIYYYNAKALNYEKLTRNILLSIEEGQLIL